MKCSHLPVRVLVASVSWCMLTVSQSAPTLRLERPTFDVLALRLEGEPGHPYRLDTSTNLTTWAFLTNASSTSGTITLAEAPTAPRRFYRASESTDVVGQVRAVGRGTARAWVRLDNAGLPVAIGVTLTASALTNLPGTSTEFVLAFPESPPIAPFRHIGLNWNPQGHPPSGIYNRPHFDVHFYAVTMQERNTITTADREKMYRSPDPSHLPPDYDLSPSSGDPRMGSHWWDLTSPELNGEPFTHALLFGYYDGILKFIEPMTTVVFLKSRPAVNMAIKQPAAFAEAGLYPRSYAIHYSPAFDEYSISLEELTHRPATTLEQPNTAASRRKPPALVSTSEDGWCRAPVSSAAAFE